MKAVYTELRNVLFSLPQVLRNWHIYTILFTIALFPQCNHLLQEGQSLNLCLTKVRKNIHNSSYTVASKQIPVRILLKNLQYKKSKLISVYVEK